MASAFAFAAACRCGRKKCDTHDQAPNTTREVLPPVAEPRRYTLDLTTRIEEHQFDGTVAIDLDIVEAVSSLTLHAKELKVHTAAFEGVGDATSITLNDEKSTVTFAFPKALPLGAGTLRITFTGEHNNQMCGFYRSAYKDIHGEEKLMVSTQFESIDARKCFPCWDEPQRKATFTCSLRV